MLYVPDALVTNREEKVTAEEAIGSLLDADSNDAQLNENGRVV